MIQDPQATIIDMTPEGGFVPPPRPRGFTLQAKGWTALAMAAGVVVVGFALLLWLAIAILPVVLALSLGLYVVSRLRLHRRRGNWMAGRAAPR